MAVGKKVQSHEDRKNCADKGVNTEAVETTDSSPNPILPRLNREAYAVLKSVAMKNLVSVMARHQREL